MEPYTRAKIHFANTKEITEFVCELNSDGTADKYVIENTESSHRVNARSLLGVIYMTTEYDDEMYLVNTTRGHIPAFVDKYRPY